MIRITPFILLLIFIIDLSSIFIVGRFTGGFMAFLLLILSELIGISLFINSIRQLALNQHKSMGEIVTNTKMMLVSFIFLLPGFISDIIGIIILIKAKQDEKKYKEQGSSFYQESSSSGNGFYTYQSYSTRTDVDEFDENGVSKRRERRDEGESKHSNVIIDVESSSTVEMQNIDKKD